MNFFPFHIGDWMSQTAFLKPMEELSYFRILQHYYRKECLPYQSAEEIAKRIRLEDHIDSVDFVLDEFFTKTETGYIKNRVEEEITKYHEKSEKMKRNARKRWDAKAMQDECKSNATNTNTNTNTNTITITNKEEVADAPARFKKPEKIEVQEYFLSLGMDGMTAFRESKKLVDFYESKNWLIGKNKMKDWQAAARNWKSRMEERYENTKRNDTDTDSTGWSSGIEIPR